MTPQDFTATIIRPALDALGLGGQAAEELLLGTAAHESHLQNIKQIGGPALGYWQIEPATHTDLWYNWIRSRPTWQHLVESLLPPEASPDDANVLIDHPQYACAIARLIYSRRPEPWPQAGDLAGQAVYWKRWYNTPEGAGAFAEYIADWKAIVGGQALA